jgi:replicative superfamily II helicase
MHHRRTLFEISQKINDPKLAELVSENGIGYHHAGMDTDDRRTIEALFLTGDLLVLSI